MAFHNGRAQIVQQEVAICEFKALFFKEPVSGLLEYLIPWVGKEGGDAVWESSRVCILFEHPLVLLPNWGQLLHHILISYNFLILSQFWEVHFGVGWNAGERKITGCLFFFIKYVIILDESTWLVRLGLLSHGRSSLIQRRTWDLSPLVGWWVQSLWSANSLLSFLLYGKHYNIINFILTTRFLLNFSPPCLD